MSARRSASLTDTSPRPSVCRTGFAFFTFNAVSAIGSSPYWGIFGVSSHTFRQEMIPQLFPHFMPNSGQSGRPTANIMQQKLFDLRSEEHTSELQSLMTTSYAVL